jgi:phospholipid transport system transporter-binding protein
VSDAARPGSFAAGEDGERWTFDGALTFENAEGVLEGAKTLALPRSGVADLAGLAHADSAALVVLLALKRRAASEGTTLSFASVPDSIVSLARVYGVDALIGV